MKSRLMVLRVCLEEVPPRCFRVPFRVPMVTGRKGGTAGEKASQNTPNLLNFENLAEALMKGDRQCCG
eukprot:scaffold4041_cov117-Skeletonema_dohrnii-CCMP3373.AAC.8